LEAIGAARTIERTILVSGDPVAQELAAEAGAEVVPDPADGGHVEAALAGIARAEAEGATCVVLLPGDCPLLDPRELDRLLTGLPERYVGIVPDRHGTGTNALLLAPPDAIAPSFGPGSRERHEQAAAASGARWRVAEPRSLVLDVDTADDLAVLRTALDARTGGAAHTRGLLARLDRQ
jgi:2-phospho-L-lactate guanylyltransferase